MTIESHQTRGPIARTSELRRENAFRVLDLLRSEVRAFSVPELAVMAGLTRPTVDAALDLLDQHGLVEHAGAAPSQGGRPAALYEAARGGAWAISMALYVPELIGVVLDARGEKAATIERSVPQGSGTDEVRQALGCLIETLLSEGAKAFGSKSRARLRAVSLAVAGTLSADRRVSLTMARLSGWKDIPLAAELEQMLSLRGVKTRVTLERYLAALGLSLSRGPSADRKGAEICMEVAGGVGVGFTGRAMQAGVNAGEFGFTQLDPAGPADATGRRGTVEAFLADPQVIGAARDRGIACADVCELYAELGRGAERSRSFSHALADRYAQALSNLTALFAPDAIEIRGAVANAGPAFHEQVAERFARLALNPCILRWAAKDLAAPCVALGREELHRALRAQLFN